MIAAVELGARSTRKGARLHYGSCCRWSALPLIGKLVTLTEANAHRVCRLARKAVRAAIEGLQTANADRTECSYEIKMDKIAAESRLVMLADLFPTTAEIARTAELLSRPRIVEPVAETAPVVVEDDLLSLIAEPVAQLSAWGALRANNLRTLPQDPKRARRHVNLAA